MSELPTQVNIRGKGVKLCSDHPKEELILVCKDCDETLVCIHCISTKHSGHKVVAVHLFVQEKFNFLQDLNTETKESKIPRISRKVNDAEITVKELQQDIQLHIKKAEDHGQYLKELITKSTAETVSELKKVEKKILKKFEQFKSDSSYVIKQLEALMKQSKEATQSDNNVLVMDLTKEFCSLAIQEPEFKCAFSMPKFTEGLDPEPSLKAAFGELEQETAKQSCAILSEDPKIYLLANIFVSIKTVTSTRQGTLWFCEQYDKPYLYKIVNNGRSRKLQMDTTVRDISLHPLKDHLYCISSDDNSLRKVNTLTMKTTKMFLVEDPYSLAVAKNGSIFVSMCSNPKVTLYTSTGTIVKTIATEDSINHLSLSRISGNVAVSFFSCGVSVMNDKLEPVFTYPAAGERMIECDATFDNAGHLLISQYNENKITILDATNGHLQKILPVEIDLSLCLTFNNSDSLVVCTGIDSDIDSGKLLSIKYLDQLK